MTTRKVTVKFSHDLNGCPQVRVGDERWSAMFDVVEFLAEAQVELEFEVEDPPTHDGTSKYGRPISYRDYNAD